MTPRANAFDAIKAAGIKTQNSIEAEKQPLLWNRPRVTLQSQLWAKLKAALQDDEESFQIVNAVFYRSPTGNYLIPTATCRERPLPSLFGANEKSSQCSIVIAKSGPMFDVTCQLLQLCSFFPFFQAMSTAMGRESPPRTGTLPQHSSVVFAYSASLMVFRGRPSGACLPCRQRRIKCDQDASGCKSCKRAQIKCHGYRSVPQTVFYNETDEVINKNRSSSKEAPKSPPKTTWSACSNSSPMLERALTPSDMGDFAFNYFRAYHFLLPHVETGPNQDMLFECMKAHGLATCAVAERCSLARVEARRHYLSAIQKVNSVLRDGHSATDDHLLLAVMMLSTIESITDSREAPLDAWKSHVEGCTAILNLRGPEQIRDPQGRLLFMQATSCLTSQCLFSSSRMPDEIQMLTDEATKYITRAHSRSGEHVQEHTEIDPCFKHMLSDKATWAMHQAGMTLTNFNSDIKCGRVQDPMHMSGQILQQDEQLNEAYRQASQSTADGMYAAEPTLMTYEEAFDQYLAIQISNSIRGCRLLLHTMNQHLLKTASATPSHEATLQASAAVIDDMRSQILESVPYQVSLAKKWLNRPNVPSGFPNLRQLLSPPAGVSTAVFVAAEHILTGSSTTQHKTFFTPQDPPILRISHGYNIIAALLLVGCVPTPGSRERKSTCELLRLLGESLSIPQAIIFAERMEASDAESVGPVPR
ncbi:hypothetical protein M409DRAFT_56275 [Zasmidium cellare ATCC 36951]|uniref:Zn(2)-C6 fungal-type domain-containing protein n=1 Tax=Zasmidium cellare ATCC 36951 TaxID=1080233 RepID=A0A6A6CD03_ZASCE|nr:uncharacterized protein M409DRAFT_56275 [Zasmidium cellare ATCC 36951]KAF2164921.1 hypothetical protein M409DRAFT_56275 [Zasmidium cellare ATCC 36951]